MKAKPLGHRRALVIAIKVLRGQVYSLHARIRAVEALENLLASLRAADRARQRQAKRRPQKKCPDCHVGHLLPPVDGKRVCDTCGYSRL